MKTKWDVNDSCIYYRVVKRDKGSCDTHATTKVKASKTDGRWTCPGKLFGTLVNSGNGLTWKVDGKPDLELDFGEAYELYLALHADYGFDKFKTTWAEVKK